MNLCPDVFPMSVCSGFFDFVMQPWFVFLTAVLALVSVALLIGIPYVWYRQEKMRSEHALDSQLRKTRELEAELKRQAKARALHVEKVVIPAMEKLVTAIKRAKPGITPLDQALVFLKALSALCNDHSLLVMVRESLYVHNKKGDIAKGIKDTYFQLYWTHDSSNNIVSFFVNWTGLESPFSLTVSL